MALRYQAAGCSSKLEAQKRSNNSTVSIWFENVKSPSVFEQKEEKDLEAAHQKQLKEETSRAADECEKALNTRQSKFNKVSEKVTSV